MRLYRAAAEQDMGAGPSAMCGDFNYYCGDGGVEQDDAQAADWFRRALDSG